MSRDGFIYMPTSGTSTCAWRKGGCRLACPPGYRVSTTADSSWSQETNLWLLWSHLTWKLMPLVSTTEDRRQAVEGLFAWSESVFNLQLVKFSLGIGPRWIAVVVLFCICLVKNWGWVEQTFKSASLCVVIHQEVSLSWCVTTDFGQRTQN